LSSLSTSSIKEIVQKLESYCAYQERCHVEVQEKLAIFVISEQEKNEIIVHLIAQNYLNEERFASLFAISKFHQKKWGKFVSKTNSKLEEYPIILSTKL
jgi:regulatory protein